MKKTSPDILPFEHDWPELTGPIESFSLLGSNLNQVYLLQGRQGRFVLKTRQRVLPGMYPAEARGLALLSPYLPVPRVLACSESALLLEYFAAGPARPAQAGQFLASLHRAWQTQFGLDHDNYLGALRQSNAPGHSWPEFLGQQRIEKQLLLLAGPRGIIPDRALWQKLQQKLPSLLPETTPSLLHGDLWTGNLYWSEQGPLFIDPAVYRGDRHLELAFTELFGGFAEEFYRAYDEVYPREKHYRQLLPLYQIYPLLVHANLFGGHYYQAALQKARYYLE